MFSTQILRFLFLIEFNAVNICSFYILKVVQSLAELKICSVSQKYSMCFIKETADLSNCLDRSRAWEIAVFGAVGHVTKDQQSIKKVNDLVH